MTNTSPSSKINGQTGENLALAYLQQQGLTLVERNVRYPFGELDLVMRQGKLWVFVEVKYRTSNRFGGAIQALSTKQIYRLRQAATHYLQVNHLDAQCRLDLIAIEAGQIHWLKNAF